MYLYLEVFCSALFSRQKTLAATSAPLPIPGLLRTKISRSGARTRTRNSNLEYLLSFSTRTPTTDRIVLLPKGKPKRHTHKKEME